MAEGRRYSEDEVHAILERALRKRTGSGMTHDELVAAASEVGISTGDLERAAQELEEGRDEREARARILAARRRGFAPHAWAYVGVNLFMIALNLIVTPGVLWSVLPALGWGIGLFFHARAAFSKEVSEKAIRREVERVTRARRKERKRVEEERRAAEKRERQERKDDQSAFERGAAELGSAVEEGVGKLLSKLADEIRYGTSEGKRDGGVRVAGGQPSRVHEDDDDAQAEEEAEAEEEDHRRKRRRR
jgi:hypothetical protein